MKIISDKLPRLIIIFILLLCHLRSQAQFNASGEVMIRSEYRNGYGNFIHKDSLPAVFIGSRCRLQFGHSSRYVQLHASVQDVRTFGSAPSKVAEPFLSLYEGWMQIRLDTNLKLKVGRQELNYDNSRFFGSADWLLSGRSHDFMLLKYEKGKIKMDAGFGFNQENEKLSGNIYTQNNYKTAQLFRGEYKTAHLLLAAIFWNEGRQYAVKDSTGKSIRQGMRFMQTAGIPAAKLVLGNTTLSGFYYHQFGLDIKGKRTDAFDCSADISQEFKLNPEKNRQLLLGVGTEIISGTNQNNTKENRSFSLLYGTNHALNGYMDFFYVSGRHEKSVGLIDYYFKTKFDLNNKLFFLVNAHYFQSQANVLDKENNRMDPYLGTELDFTTVVKVFDHFSVQMGYSQMFASGTLEYMRGMTFVSKTQNWAYLMLIYRPNGKKLFAGIVY